ncbi:MAG: ABC transporter permease [Gemmatimonadota bacterium]
MMGQDLRQDVGLLLRQIRRRPGFALVVVATLALGIGMNTAVFSLVRGILLDPLPFPDSGKLVYFAYGGASSLPNLRDLDERMRSMDVMAGVFVPQDWTLTGRGDPTQLKVSVVTPDFFRLTGLQPAQGRWLGPDDDGTYRAVLSHRLWTTRFGSDPSVVGRTVTLDGTSVEVVGVAPEEIAVPFNADMWIANYWAAGKGPRVARTWRAVEVYGRIRSDRTLGEARNELASEWARLKEEYPDANGKWRLSLVPLKDQVTRSEAMPLKILFLASSLLLLLACANVAGVFLSRLDTRRHEFAVRSSLGAGHLRLLRQAWTEALAISVLGGLVGVMLAITGVGWVTHHLDIDLPRLRSVTVDGGVMAFAVLATLLTAGIVGLVTVSAWGREEPAHALRRTGGAVVNRTGALRRALVVGEVALAFVIVTGLGLLVRSFQKLESVDAGIRTEGVVTASLGYLPQSRYPDGEARLAFERQAMARLRAVPGVEDVALSSHRPLAGCCSNGPFHRRDDPERQAEYVERRWVTPSFFRVLDIPIVEGSDFSDVGPDDPPAAIIDEGLAHELFGDESPVGSVVVGFGEELRVVGVAGPVKEYSPARNAPEMVYLSAMQSPLSSVHIIVRSGLPLDRTASGLRQALHEVDPLLPMERIRSMDDVLASYTVSQRLTTSLMSLLGALALLLGCVGIYGVMSHRVQGKLREIGVRLALGARREQVLGHTLRGALVLVLPGIILGLVGAIAVRGLMKSLLFDTSPLDPGVLVAVVALFVAAPLLAAWAPALRAARVDAVEMLKDT